MKDNIRVLLVDDHPLIHEGLQAILGSEPGIEVVGEASSGEEALEKVGELHPNVVLMDIRLPGISGTEATRQIKRAHPATAVVMLTMYDSQMYVIEAIRSGAAGYLTKDAPRELVCHAIRAVVGGGTLVRSGLLRHAVQGMLPMPQNSGDGRGSVLLERLTSRELEVLRLVAQGHRNKAIAAQLNLAEVTIKKHVQSIIGKLGATDRTHAAIAAVRLGLVE